MMMMMTTMFHVAKTVWYCINHEVSVSHCEGVISLDLIQSLVSCRHLPAWLLL